MRPDLSLAPATRTSQVPGARAVRRWPGDAAAVVLLLALPVIIFGVPALLGHRFFPVTT
jgi:hypothetical protein